MNKSSVEKLLLGIKKEYQLFAPIKRGQELFITKTENIKEIDYSGKMPINSWKQLFLPPAEALFDYQKSWRKPVFNYPKLCALNIAILDLKALGLYDLVFKDDSYYLERRRQILAVGFSAGAPNEQNFREWKLFSLKLEENILEHLPFDIFLEKSQSGDFKIHAGSETGQNVLEKNKVTNYKNIKFAGLIPEEGPDARMHALKTLVKNSTSHPLWDKLDKICLACGKCSIVCPTCFCFDFEDEPKENSITRQRIWGNCFYPNFTQIAGGQDYTKTVNKKLQFWYEHKFVRIPAEYKVPGCVSCNRCIGVCPVGIDITKNLNQLNKK